MLCLMRLAMIRTHLWNVRLIEVLPVCAVSWWPINNPSPQHDGPYTSENNSNSLNLVSGWHLWSRVSFICLCSFHTCQTWLPLHSVIVSAIKCFTQSIISAFSLCTVNTFLHFDKKSKNTKNVLFLGQENYKQFDKYQWKCDGFVLCTSTIHLSCVHCALFCHPGQFGWYFYKPGPAHGRWEYKWDARALVVDWLPRGKKKKVCKREHLPRDRNHYQIKHRSTRLLCKAMLSKMH